MCVSMCTVSVNDVADCFVYITDYDVSGEWVDIVLM